MTGVAALPGPGASQRRRDDRGVGLWRRGDLQLHDRQISCGRTTRLGRGAGLMFNLCFFASGSGSALFCCGRVAAGRTTFRTSFRGAREFSSRRFSPVCTFCCPLWRSLRVSSRLSCRTFLGCGRISDVRSDRRVRRVPPARRCLCFRASCRFCVRIGCRTPCGGGFVFCRMYGPRGCLSIFPQWGARERVCSGAGRPFRLDRRGP